MRVPHFLPSWTLPSPSNTPCWRQRRGPNLSVSSGTTPLGELDLKRTTTPERRPITNVRLVWLYTCVFRVGGTGGWSSKGCEVLNRNNSHISCQCNHMTSFAVLMDISKREVLLKTVPGYGFYGKHPTEMLTFRFLCITLHSTETFSP